MTITTLPDAPSRSDTPANFITKADAFVAALAVLVTEMNLAIASANQTKWITGTTYAIGDEVWSPADFQAYRCKVAGVSSTDPSADSTNWQRTEVSTTSLQNQTYKAYTTGGSSTAYTLTPTPAVAALAENQEFDVEFHTAAGATPTLAISGGTAKNLKYRDSTGAKQAVTLTQVPTGWRSRVVYDGTDYIVREVPMPVTSYDKIVQVVEATPYTTYTSTSVVIPNDDSIPQRTEGKEIITVPITPLNASNRLRIQAVCELLSTSSAIDVTVALFQDMVDNALAMTQTTSQGVNARISATIVHEMAAGTTLETIFKIRVGPSSGALYINGSPANRIGGGISACRLSVTEIKV